MTTPLTKPVTRYARRDELVVTLTAEGIVIREPRKRFRYGPVSYRHIQLLAAKMIAEETRREKLAAKAARKQARQESRNLSRRKA